MVGLLKALEYIALTCYKDSSVRVLIENSIVPTISFMQEKLALKMSTVFDSSLLSTYGLDGEGWCSDLTKSDIFFNNFVKWSV